jgi:hypothetical protein
LTSWPSTPIDTLSVSIIYNFQIKQLGGGEIMERTIYELAGKDKKTGF